MGLCDVFGRMSVATRTLAGVLCLVAALGQALCIFGLVLVFVVAKNNDSSSNTRADEIDRYNTAVRSYDTNVVPVITNTTASAGPAADDTARLRLTSSEVIVAGNTDGVANATSWALEASNVTARSHGANRIVSITLQHGDGEASTVEAFAQAAKTDGIVLECTAAPCSATIIRKACEDKWHGVAYRAQCRTYEGRHSCTVGCSYQRYLSAMCVPLTFDRALNKWVKSELQSCDSPFTTEDQTYGPFTEPAGINVSVVSDEDPNVVLEKITGWRRSFPSPKKQNSPPSSKSDDDDKRDLGIIFIAAGAAIMVIMYAGLAVLLCRSARSARQAGDYEQHVDGLVVGAVVASKGAECYGAA